MLSGRIGSSPRRGETDAATRAITALVVLRDKITSPVLAASQPRESQTKDRMDTLNATIQSW